MGQYAKGQTLRGRDASIRLFKAGQPLDIIEAESIKLQPQLQVIEAGPVSLGYTTRDTHVDGVEVQVPAVRKGNAFLKEILEQARRNHSTGRAFEKYTVQIAYNDPNTNTVEKVKLVDATITALDGIDSGENFSKSTEGFTLIGHLA